MNTHVRINDVKIVLLSYCRSSLPNIDQNIRDLTWFLYDAIPKYVITDEKMIKFYKKTRDMKIFMHD